MPMDRHSESFRCTSIRTGCMQLLLGGLNDSQSTRLAAALAAIRAEFSLVCIILTDVLLICESRAFSSISSHLNMCGHRV